MQVKYPGSNGPKTVEMVTDWASFRSLSSLIRSHSTRVYRLCSRLDSTSAFERSGVQSAVTGASKPDCAGMHAPRPFASSPPSLRSCELESPGMQAAKSCNSESSDFVPPAN